MTQAEYDEYYPIAVRNLAAEFAQAHGATLEDMLPAAEASFAALLTEGDSQAADQYLFTAVDGERRVGVVWFGIRRERPAPEAYVWDIVVDASCRGQGYGTLVMTALEDEVRALGVGRITLNVFAHNDGARRLYDRLGYVPVSTFMAKRL